MYSPTVTYSHLKLAQKNSCKWYIYICIWVNDNNSRSPESCGHKKGMISQKLTMIPVREDSEVVIIYPDIYI